MKINVYAAYNHAVEHLFREQQVAVIDTLRATTTIVAALTNGATCVIPVAEVDECVQRAARFPKESVLLGGERNAQLIPGFDLGNSPLEYTPQVVAGKTIVLTTTNGTQALRRAYTARNVVVAALRNAAAVASAMSEEGSDATILCAGTRQKFTMEDVLTAGCVIERLIERSGTRVQLDDLGNVALDLYQRNRFRLHQMVSRAAHYRVLMDCGCEQDIDYCLQVDKDTAVPRYRDGMITL